jgi:hypothetical protein
MENDSAYFEQGWFDREGFYSRSRIWKFNNGTPRCSLRNINYLGTFDFEPPSTPFEDKSIYEDEQELLLRPYSKIEDFEGTTIPDDNRDSSSSIHISIYLEELEHERAVSGQNYTPIFAEIPLGDPFGVYHAKPYGRPPSFSAESYFDAHDRLQEEEYNGSPITGDDDEKAHLTATSKTEPEGGLRGWLQVLAAFLLVLDGFGFITAFGVFQAHYVTFLQQSPSEISWIGSMQIFLLFLLGTISGRAIDAGHFRSIILVGFIFQLGGIFGASFSNEYWQFLLSQGIATGIGNGMHFTALVWLVSQYFTKRRGLALGISSCGAPIGAVIFTVIARELIPRVGRQWTLRIMGFLILGNSIIIYLVARPKKATPKTTSAPFLELSAFREAPYLLFCIGMFFALLGVYFAYYYVSIYPPPPFPLPNFTTMIETSTVIYCGSLV